jgi:hypothetical protein
MDPRLERLPDAKSEESEYAKELDAGCVKFMDAAGDGIVGADEACGRSAIGSDAQRLVIVCFITTSGSVLSF